MKKWEYLQVIQCSIEDLNILGLNGWELVGTIIPYNHRISSNEITTNESLTYIFKRKLK